jgi:SagB-type dehydrogenase family enzyme
LGRFAAATAKRADQLRTGLPLSSFDPDSGSADKELYLLVRRLAARGLVEYRLGRSGDGQDEVVIEPQLPDYRPRMPELGDTDVLVLSRFAYLRRRGSDLVLESPRAGALFRICSASVAAVLAALTTPQQIGQIRRRDGFPGVELLALLLDCRMLLKIEAAGDEGLRPTEGDESLVLWDFHDLLFHARSTEGRHANPIGGVYPYVDVIDPLPAVRPSWPGEKIDLTGFSAEEIAPSAAKLLRDRHSIRSFDAAHPITLAELSRFLDLTARVKSTMETPLDPDGGGPMLAYALRPYPAAGASYELELYLAVDKCGGLARGFYHYDAGGHALVPIDVRAPELEALLKGAELAMEAAAPQQVLITIAARFGRVSWKYGSIAYALVLKDVGVLLQTFYLAATDMGLGGCALGTTNIELFAKMTGLLFHIEGAVGQFAMGRGAPEESSAPGSSS